MYKLILLFLFLQSLFIKSSFNEFSKQYTNQITAGFPLNHDDVKPIITKNNDKYFVRLLPKTYSGKEYIPYSYTKEGSYHRLDFDFSNDVEITSSNINTTFDIQYIYYPRDYSFDESRFSYYVSTHTDDMSYKRKPVGLKYELYNFKYNINYYQQFINKEYIFASYYKYEEMFTGIGVESKSYSFNEQKEKFIREVVNEFNNCYYLSSLTFKFKISDYINLGSYSNDLESFSNRIPKNNIYYWYQGLYPNSDTSNNSIYNNYAFETYDNALNIIVDKYIDILFDSNNSHSSSSAYSINGYLDELIYCNEKYTNIKLYNGYLSKNTNDKNEFYLLRLPGTNSKPVAILKEWIDDGNTPEVYLKEIIKYYIIENQVIKKCSYSTPVNERAPEYDNNYVYDKDTYFIDRLDIKDIKKDINCNINYNWLSVTYKVINQNGTFKVSTNNYQNETGISFDDYGYYKIVENSLNGSKTLNDVIIKDNDRKSLCIKSDSTILTDDMFNNPNNQIYLTNKTNSNITLSFPYYDSSLISVKHNGKETELFNMINYSLTSIDSFISFPKYTISEEGSYVISISNRWGLTNTYRINISNSKATVDIKANNDEISFEINTPDGGLNSIVSYSIKRAFYKKELSKIQYEQISSSTPYIYEDLNEKSQYVKFSKTKNEYLLNNIFTFYPKVDGGEYYQIIKLYIKDSYGNIIDSVYKWNYVEPLKEIKNNNYEIDVSIDSTNVELNSSISYLPYIKENKKEISSDEYKVEIISGDEYISVDKENKKINGLKVGESKILFTFTGDYLILPITKEFKINVLNKAQNNKVEKQNDYTLFFIVIPAAIVSVGALVIVFKLINKKKKGTTTK